MEKSFNSDYENELISQIPFLRESKSEKLLNRIKNLLFRINRKYFLRDNKVERIVDDSDELEKAFKVSIVIPVYGPSPLLNRCLESISNSSGIDPEVIAISNGCDEEVINTLRNSKLNIAIVENENNLGFGKACSQGIEISSNELIVLLNSDIELYSDCLSKLCLTISKNEQIGICSAVLLNKKGRLEEAGRVLSIEGEAFPLLGDRTVKELPEVDYWVVPYASYACVLIKKSAYKAIDGFDDNYFPAYSEDVDLSIQLFKNGYKSVVAIDAWAIHFQGDSTRHLDGLDSIKEKNRNYLIQKNNDYFHSLPSLQEIRKSNANLNKAWHANSVSRRLVFMKSGSTFEDFLRMVSLPTEKLLDHFIEVVFVDREASSFSKTLMEIEDKLKDFGIRAIFLNSCNLKRYLRGRISLFDEVIFQQDIRESIPEVFLEALENSQPLAEFSNADSN